MEERRRARAVNGDGPKAQRLGEAATDKSTLTNHEFHETREGPGVYQRAITAGSHSRRMHLGKESSPDSYAIIGAFLEVHKELGPGYLEAAYGDALDLEFADRGIPALREVPMQVSYKGRELRTRYRADFLVHGRILVELKSQAALTTIDEAQVLHYLRTLGLELALLVNFGSKLMEVRRFVNQGKGSKDYVIDFA
jgi:GxxExxY protein